MRIQIKAKRTRKDASQRGLTPSNSRLKGGSTPLQNPRTNSKAATALELEEKYYAKNVADSIIANQKTLFGDEENPLIQPSSRRWSSSSRWKPSSSE